MWTLGIGLISGDSAQWYSGVAYEYNKGANADPNNVLNNGLYSTDYASVAAQYNSDAFMIADLGSAKPVGNVLVAGHNQGDGGNLNGCKLEYSSDKSSWTTWGTVSGSTSASPFFQQVTVSPATARYWRLLCDFNNPAFPALWPTEFRLGP